MGKAKYTVEFEVDEGVCELYKHVNPKDAVSACKYCALKGSLFCSDMNMHCQ